MSDNRKGWLRGVISGAETTQPDAPVYTRGHDELWSALLAAKATRLAAERRLDECRQTEQIARHAYMAHIHQHEVGIQCEEVEHPRRVGPHAFGEDDGA